MKETPLALEGIITPTGLWNAIVIILVLIGVIYGISKFVILIRDEFKKRRDEQQHDEPAVDEVGKGVEDAVIEQQYDGTEDDRRANPDELHARAGVEGSQREEVARLPILIASTADAHPAHGQEEHIDDDSEPVDAGENALGFILHSYHNLFVCWQRRLLYVDWPQRDDR